MHKVKSGSSGGGHSLTVNLYVLSSVDLHKFPSVFSNSFSFLKFSDVSVEWVSGLTR